MGVRRRSETVMTDEDMANTECTIVLLGKTGVGKSSAGNTILNMKSFAAGLSSSSVTKQCQKQSAVISGKKWTVVDTPDYFHSTHGEDLSSEIERSVALSPPGVHAFLFVLKPTTFTEQEADTVSQFQLSYGEEAFRYTMIIFTHGDLLDERMETLISENESLQSLVSRCGGRFHVLNNKNLSDRQQVYQLLEKINNMVSANGNSCYTLEMLQDVKRKAEEQRRRILEEKRRQEEKERMEHLENLEKARKETEIRVTKEMDEILEKTRAEIEANQRAEHEEKKTKSFFQLKHLWVITVFSLMVGCTLSKGFRDRWTFVHGCGLGGSAASVGLIIGKTYELIVRSHFKMSCTSPHRFSSVYYQSMNKILGLVCGGSAGLIIGYMGSEETPVRILTGLAGVVGAFTTSHRSR